jgi:hypothetical protein
VDYNTSSVVKFNVFGYVISKSRNLSLVKLLVS